MFAKTTQAISWMFENPEEIESFRREANRRCIAKLSERRKTPLDQITEVYLTLDEESCILRHYEFSLGDFCRNFKPPMPPEVPGTAYHYFKRFYLANSPMDFHPKEILVTCVYMACKIEEFNVSMNDFVNNIRGDKDKAIDIILSLELLLMQQMSYHLTIHNPYKATEGLLIDLKNRWGKLTSIEALRPGIDEFLAVSYRTYVPMIFSPSQIALAAVVNSARQKGENLDMYVTDILLADTKEHLPGLIECVRKIRLMIKNVGPITPERFKTLEKKLDICRNEENDPDSPHYLNPLGEDSDDEPDLQMPKQMKLASPPA